MPWVSDKDTKVSKNIGGTQTKREQNMHILIYSTRPHDENYLQATNKKTSYHLHFTDAVLGRDAAIMARDFDSRDPLYDQC